MTPTKRAAKPKETPDAETVLALLKQKRTKKDFDNLARFGIIASNALGVSMANIQVIAKQTGSSHDLAEELWQTGVYEARLLASFVDEPERVTAAQMDRWCKDFDNWGVVDTVCFKLFDQTPHAWAMVNKWSTRRDEYQKRAAFALMASLALHDKSAPDAPFIKGLALIDKAASDERNFVWKGVNWALRSVGRRNPALKKASTALAAKLAASDVQAERWVGKDALRDLTKPAKARA